MTEDSDILEDAIATMDWRSFQELFQTNKAMKMLEQKLKHCKAKAEAIKNQLEAELILLDAHLDANIKRFSNPKQKGRKISNLVTSSQKDNPQ